jgi:uncharacterized membrane protein YkvA (DUF1232 family)
VTELERLERILTGSDPDRAAKAAAAVGQMRGANARMGRKLIRSAPGADRDELLKLIKDATAEVAKHRTQLEEDGFWDDLGAVFRMLEAWAKLEYTALPWRAAMGAVAVGIYIVSPIDLIPDVIPVVGWIDDVLFIEVFLYALGKDIDAFQKWEAGVD